jgi:TolB-like protein/tetratricopeptide (TPR) repeat protein/tRNA A-37 threonylcarbamoyl transferase component Bud32
VTAEEWERIKAIFEAVLKVPEGQRSAYLEDVCGEDPRMMSALRDLLANHSEGSDGFSAPSAGGPRMLQCGELVADRFRVVRFIARGAMGEVYEAYDEKLRLRIAIKTLLSELTSDSEALARFRREVRMAREVAHENICRVFDLLEYSPPADRPAIACLTMELLDGENLLSYLRRKRPMAPADALPMVRQIAGGLDALHRAGIVHRDLKPSNIMLITARNGETRTVVTDFGLAKPMKEDPLFFESQVDFQAGAPFFMAPELWQDGRPSVASDVYALGLVIDEMVTKTRAFRGKSIAGLYFSKLREGPVAPSARSDGLPPHWERVILRCVETNPARRYASVLETVHDLESGAPAKWSLGLLPRAPDLGWVLRRRTLMLAAVGLPVATGAATLALSIQPPATSIVVFPIDNQTKNGEYDYLCKGTGAEIMRRLSQTNGVRVIPLYDSRAKTAAVPKGKFSLDGMLQAYRGQVRLTVQLTDMQAGELVWSENFDRNGIDNPLTLQSDIARGTVEALTDRLISPRQGSGNPLLTLVSQMRRMIAFQISGVPQSPTTSNVALDQYMRGRDLLEDMSVPSALAAIRYLETATAQDSQFALAWSALADAQFVLMEYNYAPDAELLERARGFAAQAVHRGPNVPEAHASLAAVRQMSWEWELARQSYSEALRLNPKFARAHRWFAGMQLQFGKFDETLEQVRQALDLDPYDYSAYPGYGLYYHCAKRYGDSMSILRKAIAEKNLITARHNLGNLYANLGSLSTGAAAREYFKNAFEQADNVAEWESHGPPATLTSAYSDRMYALYHALSGNPRAAEPHLQRLESGMREGHTSPVVVAWIRTALGQYDDALNLLEAALASKDRKLLYLKVHPLLEPLRNTERFQAMLQRMRLTG